MPCQRRTHYPYWMPQDGCNESQIAREQDAREQSGAVQLTQAQTDRLLWRVGIQAEREKGKRFAEKQRLMRQLRNSFLQQRKDYPHLRQTAIHRGYASPDSIQELEEELAPSQSEVPASRQRGMSNGMGTTAQDPNR